MRKRIATWLRRLVCGGAIAVLLLALTLAILWVAFPFPLERLDAWPAGAAITDRTGGVLLEVVGADQQWRCPVALDAMSPWVRQAVIATEDQRFYAHPGVDYRAAVRAAWQDVRSFRRESGASTITMQVCRMLDDRPRTLWAKAVEAFRALQLERLRSKDQILETYLNVAPFGGNVRGIEAASQRYFGKQARDLSLAEAALLAGLPQSPSRLRPDRYPDAALARRGEVLRRMRERGMIDQAQYEAARAEALVLTPRGDEALAPHAASWALQRRPGGGQTTLDPGVQREVQRLAAEHVQTLPTGTDAAVVVLDVASADLIALVGSVHPDDPHTGQVNGALARRSPGSALKPFIYAAAFEARRLGPGSTVYDVAIVRAGWAPADFDRTYAGPTTVAEALRRSLNVPAILVAEEVGLSRCVGLLEAAGVDLGAGPAARSGLSVVVGAAEVRLLDLTNAYATLGRGGRFRAPRLFVDEPSEETPVLRPDVGAALDHILSSRARPPRGMEDWRAEDVPWFTWKTGTSSARRDAWAVGHNGRFAVGVWVGRFSGAGSAEYLGREAAEPLLAHLFATAPLRRHNPDPPAPAAWPLHRPLDAPPEVGAALCITSPSPGARFQAVSGHAVVHPQANRAAGVAWFLNGSLLAPDVAPRLVLTPGRFELRCIDDAGQASAVSFTVR